MSDLQRIEAAAAKHGIVLDDDARAGFELSTLEGIHRLWKREEAKAVERALTTPAPAITEAILQTALDRQRQEFRREVAEAVSRKLAERYEARRPKAPPTVFERMQIAAERVSPRSSCWTGCRSAPLGCEWSQVPTCPRGRRPTTRRSPRGDLHRHRRRTR